MENREYPFHDEKQKLQQMLETTGIAHLALTPPFSQTMKPQSYADIATSAFSATSTDKAKSADPNLPGKEAPQSDPANGFARLPLLHVEGTDSLDASRPKNPDSSPAHSPAHPDFSVLSLLGEGGMGKVHLARQHSIQRKVAIKSVKPQDSSLEATQALLHEGQIMGSLPHPNVLPVYALGQDRHHEPLLVMKHIEGVSWKDLLADSSHPFWQQSTYTQDEQIIRHLEILMEVCNAVAFAHQQGVLHRDIKPENVMIGAFGEVLLLDWGLALRLDEAGTQQGTGPFVGTPSYMAPEMIGGTPSLQTDIYLLGATLHSILMGSPRHTGGNIYQVIFSVMESAPFSYPPSIPEELAMLCNRATHKDPQHRPESAIAFQEAIARYLRHRGSFQLTNVADQRATRLRALIEGDTQHTQEAKDPPLPESTLPEPPTVEALFSECQFAYMQALEQWSDNPRAQEGMQRCLILMCSHELNLHKLTSAQAYLKRIQHPPDALTTRIEDAIQERAAQQAEQERLQQIKDELDFEKKPLPRFLFMVGVTCLVFVAFVISLIEGVPLQQLTYTDALSLDLLLLISYAVFLLWKRKSLLARLIDRRFFLFFGICLFSGFVHHWSSYAMELPLRASNVSEELTFSLLCLFAGMAIRSWIYVGAVVSGLACVLMVAFPAYHVQIYTLNGMFLLLFLLTLLYLQLKRNPSDDASSTVA